MFTKISVLVPTRHRIERLRTMLASYELTTEEENTNSELVFRVDDDDNETQRFLSDYPHRVVVGLRHGGYANLSTFFNEAAAEAIGDVLMIGNDDMVFRTRLWPSLILACANVYPDGLFDIGLSTLNETHYPFTIISRKVVEALGFFWDPRIFWGDIFWRDVMAYYGRCVMLDSVRLDHDWAGFKPDRVFAETRTSKEKIEGDSSYWSGVHAEAVRDAIEKLRPLYAGVVGAPTHG